MRVNLSLIVYDKVVRIIKEKVDGKIRRDRLAIKYVGHPNLQKLVLLSST